MFKWAKQKSLVEATSPDGNIICQIQVDKGIIVYSVRYNDEVVIDSSRLGIKFYEEDLNVENLVLLRSVRGHHQETIELPWGDEKNIDNTYNEISLYFAKPKSVHSVLIIRFRVFNQSVAFRYEIAAQSKYERAVVKDELTEFNVNPNSTVWRIPALEPDRYEYNYEKCRIAELKQVSHTPFTIKTPRGSYLSLHEAALYDYGAMNIGIERGFKLKAEITPLSDGSKAHLDLPFRTPWRLIMLADSAIGLTKNHTMYALNEPPKSDFSWVKPLKFIGIWWAMYVGEWTWAPGEKHGATTEHAKQYINFAEKLGIDGLLIEGWNEGWEGDWLKNGINNSFTTPTRDFDLDEVSAYARRHHVELIGHHETVGFVDNYERQLEPAYNLYAAKGIHYIKTGYAGSRMQINGRKEYHHSQLGVKHYQETVELAARKKICLDIHEPIKGTGIERTWPNLLSREGARGQEYEGGSIGPSHACILPYTRLLAGGMDYTSGIFDLQNHTKPVYTTLARQLAYFVVIYSAMQMAADRPRFYLERFPQLFDFIKEIPVSFAVTTPIAGEIGEYYVVARKSRQNDDWYIGGVTNENSREIKINLDFLSSGKYQAKIYSDAKKSHYKNNPLDYEIQERKVELGDQITVRMAPGGGFAIRLRRL